MSHAVLANQDGFALPDSSIAKIARRFRGHVWLKARGCCGGEKPLPPLARQALNYAKSTVRHVLAGGARRSREEAAALWREHCQPCAHYRPSDRRCSLCGCYVLAKLRRVTERCPDARW